MIRDAACQHNEVGKDGYAAKVEKGKKGKEEIAEAKMFLLTSLLFSLMPAYLLSLHLHYTLYHTSDQLQSRQGPHTCTSITASSQLFLSRMQEEPAHSKVEVGVFRQHRLLSDVRDVVTRHGLPKVEGVVF